MPCGSTNIEKAIIASNKHLNVYMKEHPSARVAHLLLTDGEITDGSADNAYLKTLVSNDYPNIFMGYGLDHDGPLLRSLTSSGMHNEYRFVDILEKAGLVYGEVIHRLLYPAVEEVSLLAESCELYNYATNEWTTKLEIGNLISDEQKIFHVRTTTPDQALISIYGRTIHQTKQFEIISDEIVFQTHALPVKIDIESKCDLTNNLFRQKTQEYLFKTNAILEKQYELEHKPVDPYAKYNLLYQEEKDKEADANERQKIIEECQKNKQQKDLLKQQMHTFFRTMLDYIEKHNLKEDAFYKTLCDDMYIALKSFDTRHGMMYAAARQTSQGRQQTYSSIPAEDLQPSALNNDNDNDLFAALDNSKSNSNINFLTARKNPFTMPPRLSRAVSIQPMSRQLNFVPPPRQTTGAPTPQSIVSEIMASDALSGSRVRELDLDLNYTPSQNQLPAYSSPGVLKMMREVSYRAPDTNADANTNADTEESGLKIKLPCDLIDLPFP